MKTYTIKTLPKGWHLHTDVRWCKNDTGQYFVCTLHKQVTTYKIETYRFNGRTRENAIRHALKFAWTEDEKETALARPKQSELEGI
jgi:hypothetical protein